MVSCWTLNNASISCLHALTIWYDIPLILITFVCSYPTVRSPSYLTLQRYNKSTPSGRQSTFILPCLILSLLMLHICGVSKTFGEWYQKTNKTEDTNKLTLLAFKIIAILHNTWLTTFIKLLETVSKGLFRNRSQNSCHTLLDCRRTANEGV
jgi:hypothetical protein